MGVSAKETPDKTPVSFVLIDNNYLTEQGVRCFCALSKEFVPVTSNADHPAFQVKEDNLHIIYQSKPSLPDALATRKPEYGCQSIPIQTGGTRNGLFPREKLFGYIDLCCSDSDWWQGNIRPDGRKILVHRKRSITVRRTKVARMHGFGELRSRAAL